MESAQSRFIVLTSYSNNEKILVNVNDIVLVEPAERGTANVRLRDTAAKWVLESVATVHALILEVN